MKLLYKLTSGLLSFFTIAGTTLVSATINPPIAKAAGSPEVVINELMWTGSTVSIADEWIELRNNTDQVIDLAGWQLTNSATSGGALTIPAGTIAARGFFLISNFAENSASSILDVVPDLVTSAISLNNTCAPIELLKPGEDEDEDTVVDSMGCNGSSYFEGLNGTLPPLKKSMERQLILADGKLAGSWQTSAGFVNLDATAALSNFATPKKSNDDSKPLEDVGLANDGLTEDKDFTANKTEYPVSWSGFSDPESGIANYQLQIIRLGPSSAEVSTVITVTDPLVQSYTFLANQFTASPEAELGGLQEALKYEIRVRATNGVGITGAWEDSDDIVVDTQAPLAPTNVTVTDTPNDNGGTVRVLWDRSVSIDEITYEVAYKETGSAAAPTIVNAGSANEVTISGLKTNNNTPVIYQFVVTALDFSSLRSPSALGTGFALDNQAPILEETKVTLNQNRFGAVDTIHGAPGAVSESSTVFVFDRQPSEPGAILLNSIDSRSDGGFDGLSIGDNLQSKVWLTLLDKSGVASSQAKSFTNDIAGPNAPTLLSAESECVGDNCPVTLRWADNGPDSATYQLVRKSGESEILTTELTSTATVVDLPTDANWEFSVLALDKFGNKSVRSNKIAIQLTKGVRTTATFQNNQVITKTQAITTGSGAVAKTQITAPLSALVARAQAAAPVVSAPSAASASPIDLIATATQVANGQIAGQTTNPSEQTPTGPNRTRIFAIILLVIVAGSFYALRRSSGAGSGLLAKNNTVPTPGGKRRRGRPRRS